MRKEIKYKFEGEKLVLSLVIFDDHMKQNQLIAQGEIPLKELKEQLSKVK